MKINIKKRGYALFPVDQESLIAIKRLSRDKEYRIKIEEFRNYKFHKKFFALIKKGYENTKLNLPIDVYRKIMTIKAGYFKSYNTGKGVYFEADSISFDNMNQEQFEELYSHVFDVIVEDIQADRELFEKELLSFLNY